MKIPVNVKDRDTFHLTIEEYLLALISLLDELVSALFALPCIVIKLISYSVKTRTQFRNAGGPQTSVTDRTVH